VIIYNDIIIIDDTYNANLESAKAGIDLLSEYKGELTQLTVDATHNVDATFFQSKDKLISTLRQIKQTGDVIYVKGSRGMKMEVIIEKGLLI